MTHRDEFGAALGRLDTGNPGNRDDVAFFVATAFDKMQGLRGHAHTGSGAGLALCLLLAANVDHLRVAAGIKMCEFTHKGFSLFMNGILRMRRIIANLIGLLMLLAAPLQADEIPVVRMATTTSTENSGLFAVIQPVFEKQLDIRVHVIAVGTGKALELARRGDVDVVLVHARAAEEAFVAAGYGDARHEIMYNDFVIVGPATDPAGVKGLHDAGQALQKIAVAGAMFVSRGDDSGTHKKERTLWQQAGVNPVGKWYRQAGQGMGKTLQIAAEMDAYTLVDRGTWLAYRANSPLQLQVTGSDELRNPYGIIAVSAERYPEVRHAEATRLIAWFQSDAAHALIAGYRVDGEQLFYPVGVQ